MRYFIILLLFSLFCFCSDSDKEKSIDESACSFFAEGVEAVSCATKYIEAAEIQPLKAYSVDFPEFIGHDGESQGFGGYLRIQPEKSGRYYCFLNKVQPFKVLVPNDEYSPIDPNSEQFFERILEKKTPVEDCSKTDCRYSFDLNKDSLYYFLFYPVTDSCIDILLFIE